MSFYLDPKNDVTFKKVFGQHQKVLTSFLNALLPLQEKQVIEHVEYLNTELLPEISDLKSTIVDIRCHDNRGRQFLVEMQMVWTDSFQSRVLYNACKAFSHQIPMSFRIPSAYEYWGFHLAIKNQPPKAAY
jgi:predicted transposase/invertase (TIGR01784 family)